MLLSSLSTRYTHTQEHTGKHEDRYIYDKSVSAQTVQAVLNKVSPRPMIDSSGYVSTNANVRTHIHTYIKIQIHIKSRICKLRVILIKRICDNDNYNDNDINNDNDNNFT